MTSYKISNVAIQLYTLRDFTKTVADLEKTAEKIKKIGYNTVQASGLGVTPSEAKKVFDAAGITVCATHESGELILKSPEEACERLHQIGTKHTAYPWPAGVDFTNEAAVRTLAKQLDAAGAVMAKHGYTLSYHNHALEFVRFGKATVLDYIYEATNPANLKGELDTYWVQLGGGDCVAWLEKLKGRAPLLHLKDYTVQPNQQPIYSRTAARAIRLTRSKSATTIYWGCWANRAFSRRSFDAR
jgi:sugar phosphate isomerase/epimerase